MQNNLFILFIATTFNLLAPSLSIEAQTQTGFGAISGMVTDIETDEILPFVNVAINIRGNLSGTTTNLKGVYVLDSIPIGTYKVYFSYVGYTTQKIEVVVGEVNHLDVQLDVSKEQLSCGNWNLPTYNPPLFDKEDTRSGITIRRNGKGRNDFYQSNIR